MGQKLFSLKTEGWSTFVHVYRKAVDWLKLGNKVT